MIRNVLIFLCLLLSAGPSYAADSVASADYVSSLQEKAQQGDAVSQFNLAVLYHNGQGVPQDDAQAATWLRKAADQGDTDAELNLAVLYHDGQGVPRDYKQAAALCGRSAEQGNVKAQLYLSGLYKRGEGVPQDKNLSIGWLVRAVKNGGHVVVPQKPAQTASTEKFISGKAGPKPRSALLYPAVAFAILTLCLGIRFFKRKKP